MTKFYAVSTVVGALTLLAASASAQVTKPLGFSARLGLFYPTAGITQNAGGRSWFGIGADYKLGDLRMGSRDGYAASYGISVDLFNKKDFQVTPITVNYYGRTEGFYYIAGAGIGLNRKPAQSGTRSKTEFAYTLGIGYDVTKFSMPAFLELRWMGNGDSDLAGWGVFAGVRF